MQIEDIFQNLTLTLEESTDNFYANISKAKITDPLINKGDVMYMLHEIQISSTGTYVGIPVTSNAGTLIVLILMLLGTLNSLMGYLS